MIRVAFEPHLKSINKAYENFFKDHKDVCFTILKKPRWEDGGFVSIRMLIFSIKTFVDLVRGEYDLVHVNGANFGFIVYLASFFGCKYVFTIHGCPYPRFAQKEGFKKNILSRLSTFFMQVISKRAEKIYTISEFSQRELLKHYNINTCVIYNGVGVDDSSFDVHMCEKLITQYSLTDKEVVISVGRMIPCKDPYMVIDIFCVLNRKHTNLFFVFIGDGILWEKVVEYAKKKKIDKKILFLKKVNFEEMKYWYSISRYFVSGCIVEGFGLAALEAAACKCVPILPKKGAFPELFQKNTYLYEPDKISEISLVEKNEILEKELTNIVSSLSWENALIKYQNEYLKFKKN